MAIKYTHDPKEQVRSISGWYEILKEETIEYMGKEFLYLVGNGVVETSCCGPWGCLYAVVPGSIESWKLATNENGFPISILEPVRDEELQEGLRKILFEREGVSQVQFW